MYKIQNNIPNFFCVEKIKKVIDRIPTFSPTSLLKLIWDFFILINTIIMVLHLTIFLTFYGHNVELISDSFECSLVIAQVLDLLFHLNISYYSKGFYIFNYFIRRINIL